MPSLVTHFGIYAEDQGNLVDYYRGVFGWHIEKAPAIGYYTIHTAPPDGSDGADRPDGAGISGGLTYRPIPGSPSWVHYVAVESVDETVERVMRLSGGVGQAASASRLMAYCLVPPEPPDLPSASTVGQSCSASGYGLG